MAGPFGIFGQGGIIGTPVRDFFGSFGFGQQDNQQPRRLPPNNLQNDLKPPRRDSPPGGRRPTDDYPYLNDQLGNVTDDVLELIQNGIDANTLARNDAIAILTGQGGLTSQINDFYNPLIQQAGSSLPLNPFSDQLRGKLETNLQDRVTGVTTRSFNEAANALGSRGISSGGSTAQTAAGGILSESLGERNRVSSELASRQLEFNQQANQARTQIINDLANQQAQAIQQANLVAAQIKSGDVVDPTLMANTLANAYGAQLSQENKQELFDYIKTLEPTDIEKLFDAIPLVSQILFPSAERLFGLANLPGVLN